MSKWKHIQNVPHRNTFIQCFVHEDAPFQVFTIVGKSEIPIEQCELILNFQLHALYERKQQLMEDNRFVAFSSIKLKYTRIINDKGTEVEFERELDAPLNTLDTLKLLLTNDDTVIRATMTDTNKNKELWNYEQE